jgi:hypothetical protein
MLASTTGVPYTYLMGAIKNGESPTNIYHNLLIRYDKRLQPEEARIKLYAYTILQQFILENNLHNFIHNLSYLLHNKKEKAFRPSTLAAGTVLLQRRHSHMLLLFSSFSSSQTESSETLQLGFFINYFRDNYQ